MDSNNFVTIKTINSAIPKNYSTSESFYSFVILNNSL